MTYDDFNAEILEAILTGKKRDDVIKKILEEERSLPLELIKLGFNQSIYHYDAQGKRRPERTGAYDTTNKNTRWIHMLAYCDDKGVEDYIEEIFLSEQRNQGNCLLALWSKNQKKALKWLKLIHKFDPQFTRLHFNDTPFTAKICSYYSCKKEDLFNNLLLKEHKQKGEIIVDSIQKALFTEKDYYDKSPEERREIEKQVKGAFEERRKLIESGTLKPSQADKIFSVLWKGNVELKEPETEFINRDPRQVFNSSKAEGNPWDYRYNQEMKQFYDLIPQLSSASDEKLKTLYNYLPFWLEHFWPIEEFMFKIEPKKVLKDWRELILLDFNHEKPTNATETGGWMKIGRNSRRHEIQPEGKGRPRGGKPQWRTRPTPEELIKGLNRLQELEDKDLLLTIMNHYDEHVREEVQRLLKEIV